MQDWNKSSIYQSNDISREDRSFNCYISLVYLAGTPPCIWGSRVLGRIAKYELIGDRLYLEKLSFITRLISISDAGGMFSKSSATSQTPPSLLSRANELCITWWKCIGLWKTSTRRQCAYKMTGPSTQPPPLPSPLPTIFTTKITQNQITFTLTLHLSFISISSFTPTSPSINQSIIPS